MKMGKNAQNDNLDFDFALSDKPFKEPDINFDMPDINFDVPEIHEDFNMPDVEVPDNEISIDQNLSPKPSSDKKARHKAEILNRIEEQRKRDQVARELSQMKRDADRYVKEQKKLENKGFKFNDWMVALIKAMKEAESRRDEEYQVSLENRETEARNETESKIREDRVRYTELAHHRAEANEAFLASETQKAQEDAKRLIRQQWLKK